MNNTRSFQDFTSQLLAFIHSGSSDESRFNELSLALYQLQSHNVPAYRKLCEARHANPKHWTEIPAVPTTSFKDFEMTSLRADERTSVFYSSGTTEQRPSRHFHSPASLAIYETSLMRWFTEKFLDAATPSLRFISLTPSPALAPNSSLVHMFGTIAKKFKTVFTGNMDTAGAWIVNAAKTISLIEIHCSQNEPVAIVGTAFGFVHLLDAMTATKTKFKLPAGSRVMETGGYKGRSRVIPKTELHKLISTHFGVADSQIISEYGMSELSSQAYDNPDRVFRFPPWARVQIISPETNREVEIRQTGLVRIFDLANVYSVQAVQTEDLAIRHDGGFEFIGRASDAEPRGCSLMATGAVVR